MSHGAAEASSRVTINRTAERAERLPVQRRAAATKQQIEGASAHLSASSLPSGLPPPRQSVVDRHATQTQQAADAAEAAPAGAPPPPAGAPATPSAVAPTL